MAQGCSSLCTSATSPYQSCPLNMQSPCMLCLGAASALTAPACCVKALPSLTCSSSALTLAKRKVASCWEVSGLISRPMGLRPASGAKSKLVPFLQ